MPTYLRPCFLYCSLFPKNYEFEVDEVIELWIAQGYIESKGRRTLEEVAFEYTLELKERSFVDPISIYSGRRLQQPGIGFKIHDIVHDLARRNSEDEFCYIGKGKQPSPPDCALHINMDCFEGQLNLFNLKNFTRLRTLLLDATTNCIDFSGGRSLRVLKFYYGISLDFSVRDRFPLPLRYGSSIFSLYHLEKLNLNLNNTIIKLEMLGNLINLKFLSLSECATQRIPESLCLLSNLRTLCLEYCTLVMLPENIGNLVCLQKLVIDYCKQLCILPESLCKLSDLKTLSLIHCSKIVKLPDNIGNLSNLQNLIIRYTGIKYLPPSFHKLKIFSQSDVRIPLILKGLSRTVSWLKDFKNLKGTLVIKNLDHMPSIVDAHNLNLISKPYVEKLILSWITYGFLDGEKNKLELEVENDDEYNVKRKNSMELPDEDMHLRVLESLQPHPNLKHLEVCHYCNFIFPRWMGDPLSCASLQELHLIHCGLIKYLPFGNLHSLKHLNIVSCYSLETISPESVPSDLKSLIISKCGRLLSITGLEDMESLVELSIENCSGLKYLPFKFISEESYHKSSSSGLKNLTTPKKMKIKKCPRLQLAVNDVLPSVQCKIVIFDCEGLKRWCLQHNICYKPTKCVCCNLETCQSRDAVYFRQQREQDNFWDNVTTGNFDDYDSDELIARFMSLLAGIRDRRNNFEDKYYDKGKRILEINEVGSSSSQEKHNLTGQPIDLKQKEKGSMSGDVMDDDKEKGNPSTDVMDEN